MSLLNWLFYLITCGHFLTPGLPSEADAVCFYSAGTNFVPSLHAQDCAHSIACSADLSGLARDSFVFQIRSMETLIGYLKPGVFLSRGANRV